MNRLRLKEKILRANFRKIARNFTILAILFLLLSGILTAAVLSPQISEIYGLWQQGNLSDEKAPATGGNQTSGRAADQSPNQTSGRTADQTGHGSTVQAGSEEEHGVHESEWEDILRTQIMPLSTGQGIALVSVGFGWLILIAAYWLLVAVWLYQAADRARMKRSLWFLAGMIGNGAAVAAFLLLRGFLRTMCPKCGTWQKKAEFCTCCGAALMRECPNCHALASHADKFCASCGKELGENEDFKSQEITR